MSLCVSSLLSLLVSLSRLHSTRCVTIEHVFIFLTGTLSLALLVLAFHVSFG